MNIAFVSSRQRIEIIQSFKLWQLLKNEDILKLGHTL